MFRRIPRIYVFAIYQWPWKVEYLKLSLQMEHANTKWRVSSLTVANLASVRKTRCFVVVRFLGVATVDTFLRSHTLLKKIPSFSNPAVVDFEALSLVIFVLCMNSFIAFSFSFPSLYVKSLKLIVFMIYFVSKYKYFAFCIRVCCLSFCSSDASCLLANSRMMLLPHEDLWRLLSVCAHARACMRIPIHTNAYTRMYSLSVQERLSVVSFCLAVIPGTEVSFLFWLTIWR